MDRVVNKSKRNSNIELLRVVSMIMIVTLHYMNQGGVLDALVFGDINYAASWLIESFCYVSVNCYVLISGYFLCKASFKFRKLIDLVIQVVFYSVGIYLLFCALGIESFSVTTLITGYLFPIIHGEYWFATVYVVLYLLSPFLNKWIEALSQKEHRKLIFIMALVFSVIPSVFFFAGENIGVAGGYSLIWFIFVYIVSAYIRIYGINLRSRYLALIFVGCSFVTFAMKYCQMLVLKIELWDLYRYSSITVLLASIALFLIFLRRKPKNNRVWIFLGNTTFGVFLIHTQYIMRDRILWKELIRPLDYCYGNTGVFLLHMIISVMLIYLACSLIDYLRILLFNLVEKLIVSITKRKVKG